MINFFILFINTFSKEKKKKLNENFAIMLKNKELEQKLLPFLFRVNV